MPLSHRLQEYLAEFAVETSKVDVVKRHQNEQWRMAFPMTALDINDDAGISVGEFEKAGIRFTVVFTDAWPRQPITRIVRVPTVEGYKRYGTPLIS